MWTCKEHGQYENDNVCLKCSRRYSEEVEKGGHEGELNVYKRIEDLRTVVKHLCMARTKSIRDHDALAKEDGRAIDGLGEDADMAKYAYGALRKEHDATLKKLEAMLKVLVTGTKLVAVVNGYCWQKNDKRCVICNADLDRSAPNWGHKVDCELLLALAKEEEETHANNND